MDDVTTVPTAIIETIQESPNGTATLDRLHGQINAKVKYLQLTKADARKAVSNLEEAGIIESAGENRYRLPDHES